MMEDEGYVARRRLVVAQESLERAERELERIYRLCKHDWAVKYAPEYQEAYTVPGDPPGTMGIDWRGPSFVPSKTVPRWGRACKKCGKVEYTKRSKPSGARLPDFD
ncbi:MAG: hypothetical protein ACXABY_01235 [Candidatus Thorarchaeota archaeon]|jgi:hypothetical protein